MTVRTSKYCRKSEEENGRGERKNAHRNDTEIQRPNESVMTKRERESGGNTLHEVHREARIKRSATREKEGRASAKERGRNNGQEGGGE